MIRQLQRPVTDSFSEPPAREQGSASALADEADCAAVEAETAPSDRRLRNLIIAGNVVAWIVIIAIARAIFF